MKNLNIKIALLALTSLLVTGHSMANESGLFLTNSSVDKSAYLAKADVQKGRVSINDDDENNGKWWSAKCDLKETGDQKGKLCNGSFEEAGACVKKRKQCGGPSAS